MRRLIIGFVLLSLTLVAPVWGNAVSFTAGNSTRTGIGDQIGSLFDKLLITGLVDANGDVPAWPGSLDAKIGDYTFDVGTNCNTCVPFSDSFALDFTVGSSTQTFNIPFTWTGGDTDRLVTAISNTLSFDLPSGQQLFVFVRSFDTGPQGNGSFSGDVSANFSESPEPSVAVLMLLGVAGLGFVKRRQSSH
jgi:hypothetical protein